MSGQMIEWNQQNRTGEIRMDDLREILARLDRMESKIDQLATREEVMRVSDTLESIATGEVAAARAQLEDRDDARDVLLKSLIDGLENRAAGRFDALENRLDRLSDQVAEGFKMLAKNQEMTLKLLRQFGRELRELDERVDELGA